jgi:hypothetical protein
MGELRVNKIAFGILGVIFISGCGGVEKPRTVIQSLSEESLTYRYSSLEIKLRSLTLYRMALFQQPRCPQFLPISAIASLHDCYC